MRIWWPATGKQGATSPIQRKSGNASVSMSQDLQLLRRNLIKTGSMQSMHFCFSERQLETFKSIPPCNSNVQLYNTTCKSKSSGACKGVSCAGLLNTHGLRNKLQQLPYLPACPFGHAGRYGNILTVFSL